MRVILTLFIWSFCTPLSAAAVFSQETRVTLNLHGVKAEKLFSEIERQSDYVFLYKKGIAKDKTVSVYCENESVTDIFDKVLPQLDLSCRINGNQIIIMENITSAQVPQTRRNPEMQAQGVVTGNSDEVLAGAFVLEKGTTNATVTDEEGRFNLRVKTGATLVVSYMGYLDTEQKAGASMHIVLQEQPSELSEVVVVGYGVQKKVNLTGSVSSVSGQQLEDRPIQNLTSGLQGLMPGVSIMGLNGAPGLDNGIIRIRGVGTLNMASPYILVDGVETGTMNALDPNDIESVSVLKDAASAAIYGSKAANGVILITTKRGKTRRPVVSYSGYVSIQRATKTIDRMGSYEYASLYNQILEAEGRAARFTEEELAKFQAGNDPLYPDTDWYALAYQTGVQHRHNVNVSGGTEVVKYMASLGYLNQTGILRNAMRRQFNARTNLDIKISDRFTAHANMAYIKNDYKDPSSTQYGGSSEMIFRMLNVIAPWIVGRYDDGTWGTISNGSPIAWLDSGITVNRYDQNFSGTAALDYKIAEGLMLTLQGAYTSNVQNYSYFQKHIVYNSTLESEPSQLDERYYTWNRTTCNALLNYDRTFGKHGLKGLLGFQTDKFNQKNLSASRLKFPNNELTDMNAGDASTQTNAGYTRELAMVSWFGRLNYDYDGKYLFEANIRADASSRFAKGNRWGYFPSFSAGWRITEEDFMAGVKQNWLTELKIRGSWGNLGNQDMSDFYPAINTFSVGATYPFDGALNTGYYQANYRLETISWEKTRTWGLGIDLKLFERLSLSVDYYDRKTTGIIQAVTVPDEFALSPYYDNIGSMRNRGVEIELGYEMRIKRFWLGIAGNFTYNKNKILDLNGAIIETGAQQRNVAGYAFNSYYLYKADGFFNSQEEADAYTDKYGNPFGQKFMAGDLRYVDSNGDGKLDSNDRIYFERTPYPAITYGFNISAGWKGIDLMMTFNGAAKTALFFDAYDVYGNFSGDASHPSTVWRDAWAPDNLNATMPRLHYDQNSPSNYRVVKSDFWLENTAYLRLKNLQIGYTLPANILQNTGISKVRVYYSAENLFTIDRMRAKIDPEVTSDKTSSYPLIQTHAFGVNITF